MPEPATPFQRQRIEPRQQPDGRLLGRDAGEAHHATGHVQGHLAEAVAVVAAGTVVVDRAHAAGDQPHLRARRQVGQQGAGEMGNEGLRAFMVGP